MYSKPEVLPPFLVFERNAKIIGASAIRMANTFPDDIAPLRADYVKTMGTEPPPTPRYIRTHQLSASWTTVLEISPSSALLTSYNGTPYKRFVQGVRARPFHIRQGWRQESVVVPVFQKQALTIARGSWNRASNPTAGVR